MATVSAIIPCYNAPGFALRESISSALAQRSPHIEIEVVVIDDRSTEESTLEALREVSRLQGVSVIANTGPRGSAAARNIGVANAQGEWIAFLDADDYWSEGSLSARFRALDIFPDARWIGADLKEVWRDGRSAEQGRIERNLSSRWPLLAAYQQPRRPILLSSPLRVFLDRAPTHTIVTTVKRELFLEAGGFDETLYRQQDYNLFLRLARISSFVFVPEVVAYWREHDSNTTRSLTATQEGRIRALRALSRQEFADVNGLVRERIAQLYLSNSVAYRMERRFARAAWSALRGTFVSPLDHAMWRSLAASALRHR